MYHTCAYIYSDAQELLQRLHQRLANVAVVAQTQLWPAEPPLPTTLPGSVKCSNGCLTQQGRAKQANTKCIAHMCSDCCASAARTAVKYNLERDACKTHKQSLIRPHILDLLPVPVATVAPAIHAGPVTLLGPVAPLAVAAVQSAPHNPLPPGPSQGAKNNRRSLAQPLPPTWTSNFREADYEKQKIESLKMKNHRLAEERKKTIEFILYHTVCCLHV